MSGLHIQLQRLSIADQVLLAAKNFSVSPGTTLSIMGPSGCGKSSLLNWLAGLLPEAFDVKGEAILNHNSLLDRPCHARRVGLQFQDDLLFPHLSVGSNVLFGMRSGKEIARNKAARKKKSEDLLASVGLSGFFDRDPASLSGGQRARVALMRTLAAEPELLLLDEPFNKLDTGLRQDMRELVFDLVRQRGIPAVLVTHDPADAKAAGGEVFEWGK